MGYVERNALEVRFPYRGITSYKPGEAGAIVPGITRTGYGLSEETNALLAPVEANMKSDPRLSRPVIQGRDITRNTTAKPALKQSATGNVLGEGSNTRFFRVQTTEELLSDLETKEQKLTAKKSIKENPVPTTFPFWLLIAVGLFFAFKRG